MVTRDNAFKKTKQSLIFEPLPQTTLQFSVADAVKIASHIKFHCSRKTTAELLCTLQCCDSPFSNPAGIRVINQKFLKVRLAYIHDGVVQNTLSKSWSDYLPSLGVVNCESTRFAKLDRPRCQISSNSGQLVIKED